MTHISSLTHAISINPATGEQIGHYPFESVAAMDAALSRSANGFRAWRREPVAQRVQRLIALGQALRDNAQAMATMITLEMGKPIAQARGEIEKCAQLCDWYAEHGPAMLSAEPTLQAGFAEGVFEVINVTPDGVSKAIADPRIAAVTLTGSVRAGMAIGAQAGAALKKCVLELGGSDPFIVLNDANLDDAIQAAVIGRYQNTGQVCAAAKRLIIEQGIVEEFTRRFVDATRKLVVGDPLSAETYIGPMARFDLRDELDQQVRDTLEEGATLLLGGKKAQGPGNFYEPTVLAGVTDQMTSFKQELFGPVASIITARDAAHALELANDSEFGLAATVYTGNVEQAQQMASELETGGVFINGYCASDPRVTFGGVKKSGFGRELSHFGVREFCNAQTVWLDRH
eukprot:gene2335-2288_t